MLNNLFILDIVNGVCELGNFQFFLMTFDVLLLLI